MGYDKGKVNYYLELFDFWLQQNDTDMASHYLQLAIITERGIK